MLLFNSKWFSSSEISISLKINRLFVFLSLGQGVGSKQENNLQTSVSADSKEEHLLLLGSFPPGSVFLPSALGCKSPHPNTTPSVVFFGVFFLAWLLPGPGLQQKGGWLLLTALSTSKNLFAGDRQHSGA